MRIKVDEALKIHEKYGKESMPIIFLSDVYLSTTAGVLQISQGMTFDSTQYDMFYRANVFEINVIFTEKLLAKLIGNFPERYRYPWGRKSFMDMDRMIDDMENINRSSKRKRYILSCTEVYKQNSQGLYETVLNYGERLTYTRWNEVKVRLGRNALIDYRFDECGIIVFVIMKPGAPNYMQKFMNNTELISLLVEHKHELNITIAPDLNPNIDIYTVNDKKDLLQVYSDNKVRLIIVGDELNDEYKMALAMIKKHDRHARMMVVKKPDPANKLRILETIKAIYRQNIWEN